MMRSLWAGVTGLQAHQIAMDVEGHNIANVNTVGYKYTRVSFSDQMSQTAKTATAPQNQGGGKNAMQIGLGASVDAATKVFKSGSIETTDVNTDLAIEDDGFFVISDDGGKTYTYTRNGEFTRDANGNFVNTQGYIVQGWMRDPKTNTIDSTTPIRDIVIPAGMTTEAKATSYLTLKANLNSGNNIKKMMPISQLDYFRGHYDTANNHNHATSQVHNENSDNDFIFNKSEKVIEQGLDMGVMFNGDGAALNLMENQGIWVSYNNATYTNAGSAIAAGPINNIAFTLNGVAISGNIGNAANPGATPPVVASTAPQNAQQFANLINAQSKKTGVIATINEAGTGVTLTNDNRSGTLEGTKNIHITDPATGAFNAAGLLVTNQHVVTAYKYQYAKNGSNTASNQVNPDGTVTAPLDANTARTFSTTEDLRNHLRADATYMGRDQRPATAPGYPDNTLMDVTVNDLGQFQITKNAGGEHSPAVNLAVTGLSNNETGKTGISTNEKFLSVMKAMGGKITQVNSFRTSQTLNVATLSATADIIDSLGSKHTLKLDYKKVESSKENGATWQVKISVPKPGVINDSGIGPENIVMGYVRFDQNGALSTYTPANINYSPNNGAAPNQNIQLNIGAVGGHDGLTSDDRVSGVSNIHPDGYPGGDLDGVRVDASGTIMGKFTNGRSLALAQVALAKFTNNEGLETIGGNMFRQSPNSGDPIVGTANTGGRGGIKASSLEMSNVDLSRSLTQLIVVQRGFQANSKTITTSDQMLNTLLQLKQ